MAKVRKTLALDQLSNEVIMQLARRFRPTPQIIKAAVERLIDKEYLQRDPNDRRQLIYLVGRLAQPARVDRLTCTCCAGLRPLSGTAPGPWSDYMARWQTRPDSARAPGSGHSSTPSLPKTNVRPPVWLRVRSPTSSPLPRSSAPVPLVNHRMLHSHVLARDSDAACHSCNMLQLQHRPRPGSTGDRECLKTGIDP